MDAFWGKGLRVNSKKKGTPLALALRRIIYGSRHGRPKLAPKFVFQLFWTRLS